MMVRVMHVDDEPDIREVVQLSLTLDPELDLRSCASGQEALREVERFGPDLILLDVMMPGMDGPSTLARLREKPRAAAIPVVFMTARAQTRELEHFRSLGVTGVIAKPFDPMTLAVSVRGYLRATRMNGLREEFRQRARKDAAVLAAARERLAGEDRQDALATIGRIAHALAGAAGIHGFVALGHAAAQVEQAAVLAAAGGHAAALGAALDRLLEILAAC